MLPKTAPTVPDIEIADNQPAAATLDAVLARFEDTIPEILTTYLDPIVTALDAHATHLDIQAACLDAQQEIFDRLVAQRDNRNSSSSSEDFDNPIPTVGQCK